MTTKTRPSVDPSVYDLAQHWMEHYEVDPDVSVTRDWNDEDATWQLAQELQLAIETFLEVYDLREKSRA